ncbi:hypothetical protein GOP47_0006531 [Adiantum capillus-veneris]|uniref:SAM-dependent methyltransferase TRM5/TYW2-type domain-containing protein n=1 Tax=Adiantum capillus-veneris TaxID=13818 RepID=A0A9D4V3L8_ADICA|nr:hypothetical protein GOP47_0006531 [Adiantum capillus-veneris]
MQGLAVNSPTFCFDFAPQCCRGLPVHSQLKHHHCLAVRFDYEHRPIFEEGERLPARLLDSLLLAEKARLNARLVAVDISKPPPKKSVDLNRNHTQADKRRSARGRVSLPIRGDSNDDTGDGNVDDSDLFSFDDVPMYEDSDYGEDDESHDYNGEMRKHPSSGAGKYLGQVLGIPRFQLEQELKRVPGDVSEREVSIQRNVPRQNLIETPKELQQFQSSSELVSSGDVKIQNLASGRDAHTTNCEYDEQGMAHSYARSSGVVARASRGRNNLLSQEISFCDDVPSLPLGRAFNRLLFARTYRLVALQVSLAECESLADRLKGHLLNWPRISNIARVEGDDMDWDTVRLWANGKRRSKEGVEDSLFQAVYGTQAPSGQMMKRANSGEKLSSRHLKYLECISRPGRKALKEIKEERESRLNTGKQHSKKYYMVELGDSCGQTEELYLDTGLLLPGSSMGRWRGPFRLLLLDPKYAGKSMLPMAVKMLLNECSGHGKGGPRREIVSCTLTLFYKYWSMEEIISSLLPSGETLPLPIKVLGHVAVLQLGEQYSSVKFFLGKVILDKHRPKVKTVINKPEPVEGWSLPTFEVLAGNHSLVTSIVENEMQFIINLATMHWDSELAGERKRLIQKFSSKDIVCDVYAGAGALALSSAKKVWRVFANDPNSDALKYLARNVNDNKLHAKVELYNMECCVFLRKLLAFKRPVLMTQIVFSLPTRAETVKDALKGAFNRKTWPANQPLPTVSVYGFSDTSNYKRDFGQLIVDRLGLATEAIELYSVKSLDSERDIIEAYQCICAKIIPSCLPSKVFAESKNENFGQAASHVLYLASEISSIETCQACISSVCNTSAAGKYDGDGRAPVQLTVQHPV